MTAVDWDAVVAEVGLPPDWRAQGYDTAEYMVSEDSLYRSANDRRPLDYVWNGRRISHYRNHAGLWTSCPATERNHHTLEVPRSANDRRERVAR